MMQEKLHDISFVARDPRLRKVGLDRTSSDKLQNYFTVILAFFRYVMGLFVTF